MIRYGSSWLALAGAAAFALALPALVGAYEQAWDQKQAAAAAKNFEKAVNDVYRSVKLEDDNQAQANEVYLVTEDLKALHRYTRRLSGHLERGDGKDETARLFDRTLLLISRLRGSMPRTPVFASNVDGIAKARVQLEALAPFYGAELPPPVAAPGN